LLALRFPGFLSCTFGRLNLFIILYFVNLYDLPDKEIQDKEIQDKKSINRIINRIRSLELISD
jgi:hypothetical protein